VKRSGQGLIDGLGGMKRPLKWRFSTRQRADSIVHVSASDFHIEQSSVRAASLKMHTLPNSISDGEDLRPLAYGRRLGRERALLVKANGYMELSAGSILQTTMLMAELHDESRMNFSRDVLTLNVGLRMIYRKLHTDFIHGP